MKLVGDVRSKDVVKKSVLDLNGRLKKLKRELRLNEMLD